MTGDDDVGEGDTVGRMEEIGLARDFDQQLRLRRPGAVIAAVEAEGVVELCDAAAALLELCAHRLEGGAVFRPKLAKTREGIRGEVGRRDRRSRPGRAW